MYLKKLSLAPIVGGMAAALAAPVAFADALAMDGQWHAFDVDEFSAAGGATLSSSRTPRGAVFFARAWESVCRHNLHQRRKHVRERIEPAPNFVRHAPAQMLVRPRMVVPEAERVEVLRQLELPYKE